jgi:hypothetical protein
MQRSDLAIKLMSVVLFLAIAAYIGLYIYNKTEGKVITAPVSAYSSEETGRAQGYIIRREQALPKRAGAATVVVSEGEKVARDQTLAVFYEGEDALEKASRIRALQLAVEEAEAAKRARSTQQDAERAVLSLAAAVAQRDFAGLDALSLSVRRSVIAQGGMEVSDTELAALKAQLAQLIQENAGADALSAPDSGVYSGITDGYEHVGPDILSGLTPSALRAVFTESKRVAAETHGKIVTGIEWYFAAVMDKADAERLAAEQEATVRFTGGVSAVMKMKVRSVGEAEGSSAVVVFSAKTNLTDILSARELEAEVLFGSLEGLAIPTEAIYRDEEEPYIYLLTAMRAEKVKIVPIAEAGDMTIVKTGAETGTALRAGAQVIVSAKEIYDGKVMDS